MRMVLTSILAICLGFGSAFAAKGSKNLLASVDKNEKMSPALKQLVKGELVKACNNDKLIKLVEKQNQQQLSFETIKATDALWMEAEDELEIHQDLLSKFKDTGLVDVMKSHASIVEVFVMDNQGANVAMSNITSDYWQGDEDKWKMSFAQGEGNLHVSDIEFDKSAYTQLQQVSLPVFNQKNIAIGAVTFGLDINKLNQ